jgi:hypothetical protein
MDWFEDKKVGTTVCCACSTRLERDKVLAGLVESGIPLWKQLVDRAYSAPVGTVCYYHSVNGGRLIKMVKTGSSMWTDYDSDDLALRTRGVLDSGCLGWAEEVVKDVLYTMQYPLL